MRHGPLRILPEGEEGGSERRRQRGLSFFFLNLSQWTKRLDREPIDRRRALRCNPLGAESIEDTLKPANQDAEQPSRGSYWLSPAAQAP